MSMPVRCMSCGKNIGRYESRFQEKLEQKVPMKEIFESFGITRDCCKRFFMGYVNILDQLLLYPKGELRTLDSNLEKNG